MTKEYYITYKRHEGSIDFSGNGVEHLLPLLCHS